MTIWVDAQLSPAIAVWIANTFKITALALRDIGLRDAEDVVIFEAAKAQGIIFITKDSDFVDLVARFGTPTNHLVDVWEYIKFSVARNSENYFASSIRAFASR